MTSTPQPGAASPAARCHYDVLGVSRAATDREIKAAYRKMAARTHPDVAGDSLKEVFLAVQDAYGTLSDECRRAGYDRELMAQAAPRRHAATGTGTSILKALSRLSRAGRGSGARRRRSPSSRRAARG